MQDHIQYSCCRINMLISDIWNYFIGETPTMGAIPSVKSIFDTLKWLQNYYLQQ